MIWSWFLHARWPIASNLLDNLLDPSVVQELLFQFQSLISDPESRDVIVGVTESPSIWQQHSKRTAQYADRLIIISGNCIIPVQFFLVLNLILGLVRVQAILEMSEPSEYMYTCVRVYDVQVFIRILESILYLLQWVIIFLYYYVWQLGANL